MDATSLQTETKIKQNSDGKNVILPAVVGTFLVVMIVFSILIGSRRGTSKSSPIISDTTTQTKGQLTLDPKLSKSLSHLTDEERTNWRSHAGEVVRYALRYPTDFSLDDQGIYGAVLYRTSAVPSFDGKVTTVQSPKNFAYIHAMPLQDSNGIMKNVSKDFDADWASLMKITDTSKGISLKDSQSYQSARKELDTLLALKVGEKGAMYTRLEDTQFNMFTAKKYVTYSRIPGYPVGTKEVRYILETDTLTYLFGGFTGGNTVKESELITEDTLQKIFNTLIIQ